MSDSLQPHGLLPGSPLSMRFYRQEYWSGLPCPPSGNLPYPGTEPVSPVSLALAGRVCTISATWGALSTLKVKEKKVKLLSRVRLFANHGL